MNSPIEGPRIGLIAARSTLLALVISLTVWIESISLHSLYGSCAEALVIIAENAWYGSSVPTTRTAVLLYDEDLSPGLSESWPIKYDAAGEIAIELWCAGAAAVIFDIAFTENSRPDGVAVGTAEKEFLRKMHVLSGTEAADAIARNALAVACPTGSPGGRTKVFIAPPIDTHMPTDWQDLGVGVSLDVDGAYPSSNAAYSSANTSYPTAAYAASRALCADPLPGKSVQGGCPQLPVSLMPHDDWATPEEQQAFSITSGGVDDKRACSGAIGTTGMLLRLLHEGPQSNWRTCPPILTLKPDSLLDPEKVGRLLQGRAVFIGARISDQDIVDTPFHRGLPGVYIHALATNQLLVGRARLPIPSDVDEAEFLFTITLTVILIERLIGYFVKWFPRWPFGLFSAATTLLAGSKLGWPPLTCLTIAVLLTVSLGFPSWDPIENLIRFGRHLRDLARQDFTASVRQGDTDKCNVSQTDKEG